NVVGLTQQEAQQTLGNRGFQFTVTEEASDSADPGTVLSQTPAGNGQADPGSSVAIVVARAIPAVLVPDLLGQSEMEATDTLTAGGLEPRTSFRDVSDPNEDGIVLDQTPPAETSVKEGAPVRIVVGRLIGSPTTPAPAPGGADG